MKIYTNGLHYGERDHRQGASGDGECGEVVVDLEVFLRQCGDVRGDGRDDDSTPDGER